MEDDKARYTVRLLDRLGRIMAEESPAGIFLPEEVWDEIGLGEGMLYEACTSYIDGLIDKDELDHKASGFLRNWRESLQKHTGKDGNHDRAAERAEAEA